MVPVPPWVTGEEIARASHVVALAAEMRAAYAEIGRSLEVPQRSLILREKPFAAFVAMPAYSERHEVFITKVGTVVPQPDASGPTVHSLVSVFSTRTGKPLAILDGVAITNLKCAAVTALITDLCSSPQAKVLGIIGSGVQAREQIRGVGAVRKLERIQVYSRDPRRATDFIRQNQTLAGSARLIACETASDAAEGADIISTATTSTEPVLSAEALRRPGLHINCMGAHTPRSRELLPSVLEDSILIVEDVATAISEAGEINRRAIPIAELMHRDTADLRSHRTVFASTGHAFLDLLTSVHVLERRRPCHLGGGSQ